MTYERWTDWYFEEVANFENVFIEILMVGITIYWLWPICVLRDLFKGKL